MDAYERCTNLGKKPFRYYCHLWSRPRTFQTTHLPIGFVCKGISVRVIARQDMSLPLLHKSEVTLQILIPPQTPHTTHKVNQNRASGSVQRNSACRKTVPRKCAILFFECKAPKNENVRVYIPVSMLLKTENLFIIFTIAILNKTGNA